MQKKTFIMLIGAAVLLVGSIASQFFFAWELGNNPSKLKLDVLPALMAGVTIKDLDIGGTESVNAAIEEGLGFSDYRYREFKTARGEFTVYLAFWQAKKRHFLDLGTHAPDNCWVSNGWKMDPKLPKAALSILVAGGVLKTQPAEMRRFEVQGTALYVGYWHILNGVTLDYTRYGTGKTFGYLFDNIGQFLKGTGEQYFLRISSPQPLAELEGNEAFQRVLASLAAGMPLAAVSAR